MIRKKICLVGTSAVGKTSLVSRFVHSIFSDKYLTTIGVKVEKMVVTVDASQVELVIWDLAGVDEFQQLNQSYLRGSGGYVLVADGTRSSTLDRALELKGTVAEAIGSAPFVLALNKMDLRENWEIPDWRVEKLRSEGWRIEPTSAKTGEGVERAFHSLARMMS